MNLILLHGWAADSRIWDQQREALQQRAHLWAPNLPTWEAAWLQEKLHVFEPRQTVLVGWSLGGMLALEVCAAGFKPRALITIAACASFCRRPDFGLGVSPAVVRGMRQRLQSEPAAVVQDFYGQLLAPGERGWEDALQALLPQKLEPQWLSQGLDYLRRRDLRQVLSRVESETLIVAHGERDRITPAAQAYFLGDQLAGARLAMFPGAGHALMVSRSGEVNDLIAEFL